MERFNGRIQQGMWFSQDVRFITITAVGTRFLDQLNGGSVVDSGKVVRSDLEKIALVLSTRGTIIGATIENDTTVHFVLDYANAFGDQNVVTSINNEILSIGIDASITSVTLGCRPIELGDLYSFGNIFSEEFAPEFE